MSLYFSYVELNSAGIVTVVISMGSLEASQPNCARNSSRSSLSLTQRLYLPIGQTASLSSVLSEKKSIAANATSEAIITVCAMSFRFDVLIEKMNICTLHANSYVGLGSKILVFSF